MSEDASCQYRNYFLDFTSKENYVVLDEMELNDTDDISIQTLESKEIDR